MSLKTKGSVTWSMPDVVEFLNISQTLWEPSMGDPVTGQGGKYTSKLSGEFIWPFKVSLPETIIAPKSGLRHGITGILPLPPSISERGNRVFVAYEIVSTIKRAGLFNGDKEYALY